MMKPLIFSLLTFGLTLWLNSNVVMAQNTACDYCQSLTHLCIHECALAGMSDHCRSLNKQYCQTGNPSACSQGMTKLMEQIQQCQIQDNQKRLDAFWRSLTQEGMKK